MDVKAKNYLIIVIGIVFLLIGALSMMSSSSVWNYVTLGVGIILLVLGAIGLKQGRVIG